MIGKLDQRVTIQTLTRVADSMGGAPETWAELATVWAHVRPMRGDEGYTGDRVDATGTYRFVIRNRTDVSEAARLQWQGETYNIRAVRREGPRPMYLDIDAERGAAA